MRGSKPVLRQAARQDRRKPIDTQAHSLRGGGYGTDLHDVHGWARAGDATKNPTFDHGIKRKQQKIRKPWY
jgi:hypothetical protein